MIFKSNQDPETPVLPRDFSYLHITSKIFLGFVDFLAKIRTYNNR